jgi:hypothetical protein
LKTQSFLPPAEDLSCRPPIPILLEIARPLSFFLSILSLYPVLLSAFFVPGSRWQERLILAMFRIALAACVCFASGLLYAWPADEPATRVMATLPVRLFFWTTLAVSVLFTVTWYLEEYYIPLTRHGCCRP